MAFSRKYGTVWYHPASSKLWYLTVLSFVNFRKIDWHTLESVRVLSQLRSACCVLGAGCGFCVNTRHASDGIEASRRTRILSPSAEPSVLVLWLNQVTRRFSGEPPQTLCVDSSCEPLPCTGSDGRLRVAH
jgi:hypothetical protein